MQTATLQNNSALSQDNLNLFTLYRQNGYKPVLCKGYHPQYNPSQDYKTAKQPKDQGFTREGYVGPSDFLIEEHIKQGGWVGWVLPEGVLVVDYDDGTEDEQLIESTFFKSRINPGIVKTNNGKQAVFKDPGRISGTVEYCKIGSLVCYRIGGKNYCILPPVNERTIERWVDNEDLPLLPQELFPASSLDDYVKVLSWQLGKKYRQGLIQGNDDLDLSYMAYLVSLNLSQEDVINAFTKVFGNEFDRNRTIKLYKRAVERAKSGEPLRGAGSFIQSIKDKGLNQIAGITSKINRLILPFNEDTRICSNSLLDYNLTDSGNAECFKDVYGNEYVFVPERKKWFHFNGIRFIDDNSALPKLLETIRAKNKEAFRLFTANPGVSSPDEKLNKTIKWCLSSENKMRLSAALAIAESLMAQSITSFDADPMMLCCLNGAVDLKNGKFFIPTKDDYLQKSINTIYDPEATCPEFLKFIEEVFNYDNALIDFAQKAVGYSLTGLNTEQVLFICYGTGANGKSVFLNTISDLLGDYSITTPPSTFKDNSQDGVPNDIARMVGARLVKAIELKEGTRLNEERIKALTGGDKIAARFLHNEYFEFIPVHKLWIATNHKPIIRGTDEAIWRRIRLIPFEVYFPPEKRKKDLYERLKNELPGILNWAIEGCLKWQREGLEPVGKVKEYTISYRAESDIIEQFLEERTRGKPTGRVQAKILYHAYEKWCGDNGEYCISGTMFGKRLQEKGFIKKKTDYVYYYGLELVEDTEWEG